MRRRQTSQRGLKLKEYTKHQHTLFVPLARDNLPDFRESFLYMLVGVFLLIWMTI